MRTPDAMFLLLTLATGCENPKSDMGDQPRYGPYAPSKLFADGTSARPPVTGTVPRNDDSVPGLPYTAHTPTDELSQPALPDQPIPFPITRQVLTAGQLAFNIHCSPCHGQLANGQGMIVQRGLTPPPSFHVPRLRNAPDSHFYNVITHGYGAMYPYADRIPPETRWQIIAYLRALQLAGEHAPPEAQRALIAQGDRATANDGKGESR